MNPTSQEKNALRLLGSLLIASAIVFAVLLACNLFTGLLSWIATIGKPLALSVQENHKLIWGAVFGAGAVALVWVGGGITYALKKIPNKILGAFLAVSIFLMTPLALIGWFAVPYMGRWFDSVAQSPDWKTLPPVPERVVEFVDADIANVYVRTESGKILGCTTTAPTSCWKEFQSPITVMQRTRRIEVTTQARPPTNAVRTFGIAFDATAETGADAYYALLPDNSIEWWRRDSPHPFVVMFGWLVAPAIAFGITVLFMPIYLGAAIVGLSRG